MPGVLVLLEISLEEILFHWSSAINNFLLPQDVRLRPTEVQVLPSRHNVVGGSPAFWTHWGSSPAPTAFPGRSCNPKVLGGSTPMVVLCLDPLLFGAEIPTLLFCQKVLPFEIRWRQPCSHGSPRCSPCSTRAYQSYAKCGQEDGNGACKCEMAIQEGYTKVPQALVIPPVKPLCPWGPLHSRPVVGVANCLHRHCSLVLDKSS